MNSDHILLWYYSFSKFYSSSQNLEKLLAIANGSDYVDISLKFNTDNTHYKVKCCAVYPIYAKPIEVIGATIEDIRETSRRRSGRSDDNEEQVGTEAVEGISLDMENEENLKDVHLSCHVFDKMHFLRFLLFTESYFCESIKLHLPDGLNDLSDRLRILQWPKYPSRVLPSKFYPKNLVKLDLSDSNIEQLWEGTKGSEESPTQFTIFLPGSEIPNCFSYQSSGSSVNIPVLRQALVNRKLMGFAMCAVLGFEEFHQYHNILSVGVSCHFETCYDYIYVTPYYYHDYDKIFVNSDHILLWYYSFSQFYSSPQNLEKLLAIVNGSDYVDISLKFTIDNEHFKVKCCAVYPIYAEPIEVIGATIEDIGEASRRRSGRSDDNEEQVVPHP
ncbi:hypothetical protein LWI29_005556 [Acer saccharum]|uniref:C-JID domain-containing protein n=1 Tax=Acer saccharum TaxID=4024 RepID=A0AA39W2C2_ACESA|nr:hypothetical protein LWI29_005556 [Acer saccharum]